MLHIMYVVLLHRALHSFIPYLHTSGLFVCARGTAMCATHCSVDVALVFLFAIQ